MQGHTEEDREAEAAVMLIFAVIVAFAVGFGATGLGANRWLSISLSLFSFLGSFVFVAYITRDESEDQ